MYVCVCVCVSMYDPLITGKICQTQTNLLVLACVWDFSNKISGTIYWIMKIYASNLALDVFVIPKLT